ncbi:sensor histidine kinase [Adhaeribacter radiodurans]|uniref:Histidine kinase n=1 Tax=Adhaeribacter radiodurans TaxID=2745197 RepID=A0A7L7LEC3_9BACT|nr:histidine kinase [Adhaeribacter radiodurans]QMU30875.1 histidine kinase [Adhaeribacter radiodurans]
MNKNFNYFFPALFGLLIYANIRLVNDTVAGEKFWERPWQTNVIEIVFVVGFGYIMQFQLNYLIQKFSSDTTRTINPKVILKEFATVFIACLILLNLFLIPFMAVTDDGLQIQDVVIGNIIPGLYLLLYFAIVRGNRYLQAFIQQRVKLEQIEKDQLQTELKFLKAQYHPHFLFNALNTIYFQMDEDVEAAKKTVEKFSELLRYQLYGQNQTVPIGRELGYLQTYIDLQKARMNEHLQLEVCFEWQLKEQPIYPMLLLPLIENAFKYVGGNYWIKITAKWQDHKLLFRVENAIPANTVRTNKDGGIGLENLRRRLNMLYPNAHCLQLEKNTESYQATLALTI